MTALHAYLYEEVEFRLSGTYCRAEPEVGLSADYCEDEDIEHIIVGGKDILAGMIPETRQAVIDAFMSAIGQARVVEALMEEG